MNRLRNLIIGAMLDALDDNMLAKHYYDIERMADEALAIVAPLIQNEALEQVAAIADSLRAENERLREALKPFAAAADWDWSITIWKDEPRQNAQVLWHNAKQEGITLADFDTANALLARKEARDAE